MPAATLAHHGHVGHELHLDADHTLTLTVRATAAVDVEGEVRMAETVDLGVRLLGEQFADVVINLQVRHGV